MNARLLSALFSTALLAAGGAYAATPAQQNQNNNSSATGTSGKAIAESVTETGTIKSYKQGHSITLQQPSGHTRTFSLSGKDLTANVSPNLKTGNEVMVTESTDANGRRMISVSPMTAANASATLGPGVQSTRTVNGVVKSYDKGKSISVKAPDGKVRKFSLSGTDIASANVNPQVNTGSEVTVTEQTQSDGKKIVQVEPAGTAANAAGMPGSQDNQPNNSQ